MISLSSQIGASSCLHVVYVTIVYVYVYEYVRALVLNMGVY